MAEAGWRTREAGDSILSVRFLRKGYCKSRKDMIQYEPSGPDRRGKTANTKTYHKTKESKKMVSDKAIAYFNEKVREVAAGLGLPATAEAVEVLRDEGSLRTAFIQFDPAVYDADTAEHVADEFVKDSNVISEGLWGYDYALGSEMEEWEGCETQYFFDVSALEDPTFVEATDKEREEWRKENVLKCAISNSMSRNVFLPVKFKYFDDIAAGRKTVECRNYVQRWVDALFKNHLQTVTFQRGYAKGAKQMTFSVEFIEIADADGRHRYPIEAIPDFSDPEWILIHLGKREI